MEKGRKEAKVARRKENTEKGDDRRDREKCEQIGDSRRKGRARETERERNSRGGSGGRVVVLWREKEDKFSEGAK